MDIIESIRDIPVQDPPEEEFSSANLNWSKFGTAGQNNEVALIPNARVDAFIIGECSNIECPTRFHIERVRKRCKGSLKEYASDEYLEYRKYWCSFGPENYGEGGGILPSRRYRLETRNRAAIPQSMRGCTCHFIVKRLYACPSLALIIYNNKRHINKAGFVCHGPLDGDAIGPGAKKIPYICNEIQQQTMSMIYLGIPEENILDKHIEGIERYCGSNAKAKSLASQYVHKLGMIIKRSTHELDLDDQVSIRMWVDRNKKSVFFYQDNSDNDAFILGIQTEWQLQQMVRFGHHSLIASDSTVGLKNLKYPLCTLLVFDSRQHALPIAWIITRSNAKTDVTKWMKALLDRIRVVDQSWTSKGFIIDDPITEIDSIRDIFSCPILFSIWRVRRSWLRHVVKKCNSVEVQQEIFKRLGEIVYSIWEGDDYLVALEDLIHSFVDQSAFLQYFKASWVPKLEMWLNTMRTVPLASQEASGAIEAYHVKLKLKLYDDDSPVGALQRLQRVDWLAHKLTTELHSSYWLDRYADESGSFSNVKEEYINSTSWYRAKQIPDSAVILDDKDNLFAKVTSQKDNTLTHQVFNPGSEFAFCDCSWSLQGNICKHIIKVNMFCKNHKEYKDPMSLKSFEEILSELQRKPVDDSISMDLSMAWALQMLDQIQKLVELSGSENIAGVVNNMPLKWVAKKGRTSVGRPFDPLALPSSLKSKRAPCRKNRKRKRLAQLC